MALKALFTRADVKAECDAYFERIVKASVESFKYVGEQFITASRDLRTYQDRTGNLRASCGYLIILNGDIIESVFDAGDSADGKRVGEEYAKKLALEFGKQGHLVFIGVAGMMYAVYVEAKGFDVITGSSNEAVKLLERLLKRIK
jgi:hypothetical protein